MVVGLDQLLEENRISDLTLMYQLFYRVRDGLKELCIHFGAYIKVGPQRPGCHGALLCLRRRQAAELKVMRPVMITLTKRGQHMWPTSLYYMYS